MSLERGQARRALGYSNVAKGNVFSGFGESAFNSLWIALARSNSRFYDQDGHVADIGCRFPPVLENARLPGQLAGERTALRWIGIGRILHVAQLLGFLADLLGHRLLLARKTLDAVHHLVALRVEPRIERGKQRLRLILFLLAGSHDMSAISFRASSIGVRRAARRATRSASSGRPAWCRPRRSAGLPRRSRSKFPGPSIAGKASRDSGDRARTRTATSRPPATPQRSKKYHTPNEPSRASLRVRDHVLVLQRHAGAAVLLGIIRHPHAHGKSNPPGMKDVASRNIDRHRRHGILPCGGRESREGCRCAIVPAKDCGSCWHPHG